MVLGFWFEIGMLLNAAWSGSAMMCLLRDEVTGARRERTYAAAMESRLSPVFLFCQVVLCTQRPGSLLCLPIIYVPVNDYSLQFSPLIASLIVIRGSLERFLVSTILISFSEEQSHYLDHVDHYFLSA